uniref:Uncharacterized protein n=1 Tax=viral metagenome TaxID=1070528 RepID=A0A6C0JAV2_9ZZZZ
MRLTSFGSLDSGLKNVYKDRGDATKYMLIPNRGIVLTSSEDTIQLYMIRHKKLREQMLNERHRLIALYNITAAPPLSI